MDTGVFIDIGRLLVGAKTRQAEQYDKFLEAYRTLVETVPADVAKAFGALRNIDTTSGTDWGIELTATDYLWWKAHFARGTRFTRETPEQVWARMLTHLAKKAEAAELTADERRELLALLDPK